MRVKLGREGGNEGGGRRKLNYIAMSPGFIPPLPGQMSNKRTTFTMRRETLFKVNRLLSAEMKAALPALVSELHRPDPFLGLLFAQYCQRMNF